MLACWMLRACAPRATWLAWPICLHGRKTVLIDRRGVLPTPACRDQCAAPACLDAGAGRARRHRLHLAAPETGEQYVTRLCDPRERRHLCELPQAPARAGRAGHARTPAPGGLHPRPAAEPHHPARGARALARHAGAGAGHGLTKAPWRPTCRNVGASRCTKTTCSPLHMTRAPPAFPRALATRTASTSTACA